MKHQTSLVNVVGTVVSVDLMVLMSSSSFRDTVLKALNSITPQINKNIHLQHVLAGPQTNKSIKMKPPSY